MTARADAWRGARRAGALVAGDLAWGLAFGALARASGLTAAESAAMSGVVFAGTAQVAALGLWPHGGAPFPTAAIVLTTLVVNLRLVLLGASLAPSLARTPARRAYAAMWFLSDETWALAAAERARGNEAGAAFVAGSGGALWLAWVGGSVAGYAIGAAVGHPERWGLDFAATAAMLVLLVTLRRGRGDAIPWLAAGAASVAAAWLLPGSWYILIGAAVGSAAGALTAAPDASPESAHAG